MLLVDERPHALPAGCWDLWRPGALPGAPRVLAAPMASAGHERRLEALAIGPEIIVSYYICHESILLITSIIYM